MSNFEISDDSIFDPALELDMILNPVNCKGVSGAGLAKAFAKRFPYAQGQYEAVCKRTMMAPDATGRKRKVSVFSPGDILHYVDIDSEEQKLSDISVDANDEDIRSFVQDNMKHIIFFPTKNHWKRPSKIEYIENGLSTLSKFLGENRELGVERIGIPALGCGLGGLDPIEVSTSIYNNLKELDYTFVLFRPLVLL